MSDTGAGHKLSGTGVIVLHKSRVQTVSDTGAEYKVCLTQGWSTKRVSHRVVAQTVSNCKSGVQTDHKSGVQTDHFSGPLVFLLFSLM